MDFLSCFLHFVVKEAFYSGLSQTSGVSESALPDKHGDNVGGLITDGSCVCCQL